MLPALLVGKAKGVRDFQLCRMCSVQKESQSTARYETITIKELAKVLGRSIEKPSI